MWHIKRKRERERESGRARLWVVRDRRIAFTLTTCDTTHTLLPSLSLFLFLFYICSSVTTLSPRLPVCPSSSLLLQQTHVLTPLSLSFLFLIFRKLPRSLHRVSFETPHIFSVFVLYSISLSLSLSMYIYIYTTFTYRPSFPSVFS